jgi:hypothetical protein
VRRVVYVVERASVHRTLCSAVSALALDELVEVQWMRSGPGPSAAGETPMDTYNATGGRP